MSTDFRALCAERPSDDELGLIYHDCCGGCEFMDQGGFEDAARAVLARWGRPAQPAPVAEGEIDQLVSQLYDYAQGEADNGWHDDAARFRRAAELLPRLVEAMDAFTSLRNEILHGLDGFDPDQTNAVLDVIDNHTPEWV